MKSVLMVAEKPSLAKTIADILSNHTAREVKITGKSVYLWNGQFCTNEMVIFKMTSVFGHVYSIDFDQEFNKRIDPSMLFNATIIRKEAMPKLRVSQFLRSMAENEGKGLDYLVLWLDCDKEGENICFEVLDNVKRSFNNKSVRINYNNFMGSANIKKYQHSNTDRLVYRAKFSSLAPNEIKLAFNNLIEPNYLESRSVDARQELDLRIGCAFTRLQTWNLNKAISQDEKIVVSFGPCQTPTLGFCVARDDFIKNFKSENFWTLRAEVSPNQSLYPSSNSALNCVRLHWERGRLFDRSVVAAYLEMLKNTSGNKALVRSVSSNIRHCQPPLALNTVQLLRIASSAFGFSPHFTMELAEKLYTSGYISYPRTETTVYSPEFDFASIIQSAQNSYGFMQSFQSSQGIHNFQAILQSLYRNGYIGPEGGGRRGPGGKDVGDHPPITPTPQLFAGPDAGGRHLSREAKTLYDYIFTHFVATLMSSAKYLDHVTTFDISGEGFSSEHRELLDAGYMEIMPWKLGENGLSRVHQQTGLEFREGMYYPLTKLEISEGHTNPPSLLTESDLIKLMEEHGIGTDASIPVHIKKILDRNYVRIGNNPYGAHNKQRSNLKRNDSFTNIYNEWDTNDNDGGDPSGGDKAPTGKSKARYLMPTPLGIALVRGYEMIDLELVLPTMRAAMETQLNLIAHGRADYQAMVQHAIEIYQSKYAFFSRHLDLITTTFMSIIQSGPASSYRITQNNSSSDGSGGGRTNLTRTNSFGSFDGRSSGRGGGRGKRGGSRGRGRGRGGGAFKRGGSRGSGRLSHASSSGEINIPYNVASNASANPYYNLDRLQKFL